MKCGAWVRADTGETLGFELSVLALKLERLRELHLSDPRLYIFDEIGVLKDSMQGFTNGTYTQCEGRIFVDINPRPVFDEEFVTFACDTCSCRRYSGMPHDANDLSDWIVARIAELPDAQIEEI